MSSYSCYFIFYPDQERQPGSGRYCVIRESIRQPFISKCNLLTERYSLRKRAYSNILKTSPLKTEKKKSDKNSNSFRISAENIDCRYSLEPPRRGGSNEYPQSMFSEEIRRIMYTPVNPSFTI